MHVVLVRDAAHSSHTVTLPAKPHANTYLHLEVRSAVEPVEPTPPPARVVDVGFAIARTFRFPVARIRRFRIAVDKPGSLRLRVPLGTLQLRVLWGPQRYSCISVRGGRRRWLLRGGQDLRARQ
jgi:hypothetical protein